MVNLNNQTPEKPSFLLSGITKTPEQVIVQVQNSDDADEEYDTDNEIGLFFDQVMDEGELMIQEQPLNSTLAEITALAPQHAMNPTLTPSNDPNMFVSFMNTSPKPIGTTPPLAFVQP